METTAKRMKIISIILIILLVVNLAGLGTLLFYKFSGPRPPRNFAGKGCMHHPTKGENPCFNDFLKKELNLSKKQEDDFMKIKNDYQDLARNYMDSIEQLKGVMFDEMIKEKPDNKVIEANTVKSTELFTMLQKKTVDHFLSIKSIFTPEQQSRYFKFVKDKSCCAKQGMAPEAPCCQGPRDGNGTGEPDSNCPGKMNCPQHGGRPYSE